MEGQSASPSDSQGRESRERSTEGQPSHGTNSAVRRTATKTSDRPGLDLSQLRDTVPPTALIHYLQGSKGSLVLDSLKQDCERRNLCWFGESAQRFAADLFLRHPLAVRFPPRPSVLKQFLRLYIAAIEQELAVRLTSDDVAVAPPQEDGDPIYSELLSAHIDMFLTADKEESTMCFKTFLNLDTPPRPMESTLVSLDGPGKGCPLVTHDLLGSPSYLKPEGQTATSSQTHAARGVQSDVVCAPSVGSGRANAYATWTWNPFYVATDTFRNVGLSLWPAAFALVQLLSQEFRGASNIIPVIAATTTRSLRVVELGAGVGLTPCILATQPGFVSKVLRFCATDYQVELIENMRRNYWINQLVEADREVLESQTLTSMQRRLFDTESVERDVALPSVQGLHVDESMLKDMVRRPEQFDVEGNPLTAYSLQLLDWNELECCESFFSTHGSDLLLAADCVYDVSVIPALVAVLHAGLDALSVEDVLLEESMRWKGMTPLSCAQSKSRAAVVVQTHRQASTIKTFFDEIATYPTLEVQSYRLVQIPLREARQLYASSPEKHIPLGDWASIPPGPIAHHETDLVCLLRPDGVLPDGRFESMKDVNDDSAFAEAMRDGFIGSYYVSMVGLIGVHVITKKSIN